MNRIKKIRIEQGLTQKEVCQITGVPISTLADWENDRHSPPKWAERFLIEILEMERLNIEKMKAKRNNTPQKNNTTTKKTKNSK